MIQLNSKRNERRWVLNAPRQTKKANKSQHIIFLFVMHCIVHCIVLHCSIRTLFADPIQFVCFFSFSFYAQCILYTLPALFVSHDGFVILSLSTLKCKFFPSSLLFRPFTAFNWNDWTIFALLMFVQFQVHNTHV